MARDWRKFDFNELCLMWNYHLKKTDSLNGITNHRWLELSKEDLEDLVTYLLQKIDRLREDIK